jgi:hypothetical protein
MSESEEKNILVLCCHLADKIANRFFILLQVFHCSMEISGPTRFALLENAKKFNLLVCDNYSRGESN